MSRKEEGMSRKPSRSLIERAVEEFDRPSILSGRTAPDLPPVAEEAPVAPPAPEASPPAEATARLEPTSLHVPQAGQEAAQSQLPAQSQTQPWVERRRPPTPNEIAAAQDAAAARAPLPSPGAPAAALRQAQPSGRIYPIDRRRVRDSGFIDPDGEVTNTGEEFRIVKRRILTSAFGSGSQPAEDRGTYVLISSSHPGDGKSWCAINLALSLAAEQNLDVVLVDADFPKPSVCTRLGLPAGPGFMDALVDPAVQVETLLLQTDIPSLKVLPAGRQVRNDTEFVASDSTRLVLDRLAGGNARRIIILDSPPTLAASVGSELARHVGQTLLIVRADRTSDAALRDAVALLSACPNIKLLLNGVKFSSSGRVFGSYYGQSV
jgi:Mrp family chromosome partitioning ATPase